VSLPRYEPMLATRWARSFDDDGWLFEVKWDGVRVVASVESGGVTLRSRRGIDVSRTYPELAGMRFEVETVLDGELVAFDDEGLPSFGRLQQRINLTGESRVVEASRANPVGYIVFDLLFHGVELIQSPLEDRLARLDALDLPPGVVRSEWVRGEGTALFAQVRSRGLEGVVAKRLGSLYRPGVRSPDWRKVPAVQRLRAVVGGFLPGEGGRARTFGSLLLGLYVGDRLRWIGAVGTGFDNRALAAVREALTDLETDHSPFQPDAEMPRMARWVVPSLVAEVEFKQWTKAGRLRAPSLKAFSLEPPEELTWEAEGPEEGPASR